MSTTQVTTRTLTRRRSMAALGALAFAQLIFSLDLNIVFVALPSIGDALGFTAQTRQWVVSAYVVAAGGFLLFGGRAADLLGRRRVFVTALVVYAVASLAGGLATTPATIVIARAAQGVGGALLLPSTLSLINTLYTEGRERNRALAIWGGFGASGLTLGALAGGVLTEAFGWPAVFFVNVPLAAAVVVVALWAIPSDISDHARRRFDTPGAVTATVAATGLVFTLVQGPEIGWGNRIVIAAFVVAVIAAGVFVAVERTGTDPLMPLRLWRGRPLVVGAATTFIYMATFGALPYFLTVQLQQGLEFNALESGLAFLVPSIAIAAGTQLGERLTGRLGLHRTLVAGFGIGIVGTVALGIGFTAGYWAMVPGLVVSGIGQGIVWTAMFIIAATGVAAEEQGVANGIATTALNLGNAIGLALLIAAAGSIGTAVQGGQFAVYLAAAGMVLGVLVACTLRRD